MLPPPTSSPLFPYTTLFRSLEARDLGKLNVHQDEVRAMRACERYRVEPVARLDGAVAVCVQEVVKELDRKSTRLNSSHLGISYAVFCLKKKKKRDKQQSIS